MTDEPKPCGMPEPRPYIVGNTYQTQEGKWVKFIGVSHEGTDHETMFDEFGIFRYTRRDHGRVTGTCHNYSDPRNTPPLYYKADLAAPQVSEEKRKAVIDRAEHTLQYHTEEFSGTSENNHTVSDHAGGITYADLRLMVEALKSPAVQAVRPRLIGFLRTIAEGKNKLDDCAADAVTVEMVWQKEAQDLIDLLAAEDGKAVG